MCSQGAKGLMRVTIEKEEGYFPSLSKDLYERQQSWNFKVKHHRIDSLCTLERSQGTEQEGRLRKVILCRGWRMGSNPNLVNIYLMLYG